MRQRVALLSCLLLSLFVGALGKGDKPKVEETKFDDVPANLFYFEDSDVVLVTDPKARITYRSEDAGVVWSPLNGVEKGQVLEVLKHPFNNQVAVVIGIDKVHWVTKDQGKTWKSWRCKDMPALTRPAISFHATDPDRMLFMTANCLGWDCDETVYYTRDGFDTDPKVLLDDAVACLWAKSTNLFSTGSRNSDDNRVLCTVKGAFNPFMNNFRLLISDDFFDTQTEPAMNQGRAVSGVMSLAAVKSYIVAAAKSEGTNELAMYVTDDAEKWHRAEFGEHKLEEDAYTLLESTNYSMQVDVLTTRPTSPMGVLLTSNSNGTFFTKNVEHTNRNMRGFVDFEKIQNIQGIVLVNTVTNWEEVERNWLAEKEIISQISFNDGRFWLPLKAEGDDLHLHSVTDQRNTGRIFSSPAPGIVMGVGNTGKRLRDYSDGDLYVSDDAGFHWKKARSGPHLYEFGDQGSIIVAIEDGETDKIRWSLNHGEDWDKMELEHDIRPLALTTVPDSTSLKFILTASKGRGENIEYFIYSFDFSALDVDDCRNKDFEDWYARVNREGEPTCIMGHTQKFRRRKSDAKCFVNEKHFHEAAPIADDCKCKQRDFECDYENGFTHHEDECKLTGRMPQPEGACKEGDETFMGPSGYRLIPGNTCVRKGGVELDEPIKRPCKDLKKPIASGKIATEITRFEGDRFLEYYYLERAESSHGDDETVIMRTDRREAFLSKDHGKLWEPIVRDEEVVAIYPHQYINDNVYLITPSDKVYYSTNRGSSFNTFKAPEKPNMQGIQILSFHPDPKNSDWLIWTGGLASSGGFEQSIAHVSTHGGDQWEPLLRSVRKCQFVYREGQIGTARTVDKLVYCEQYEKQDPANPLSLVSSDDWFEHKMELKRDVINFATMAEYIVVAVRQPDLQSLQVDTSIDGQVFADAKFPYNFEVPHQRAYTVLDSSTHAVFLHVTVNNIEEQEYGSIIKSNSNGTSYVLAVSEVNRNRQGYVDFEKMLGLEGVAIINRVANVKQVENGASKKLKTYMTHNDGADWALVPKPEKNFKGEKYDCDDCSLHLHGYTERSDPRDTYSSATAIGVMMATGNVGEYLGYKKDADTFITPDGGLKWYAAAPGNWMWEYGDQGSIIVIVKENEPTSTVLYTLNQGKDWIPYDFSDNEMIVTDITTVPSDMSMNFLLWGKIKGDLVTVNLDFSGINERQRKCVLDENNPTGEQSDYRLWSPAHPNSDDDCLFGHVAQYHRKKPDRECYNGAEKKIQHLHAIKNNCTCTRADFECDYNYERSSDGHCQIVKGLTASDPIDVCRNNPDLIEYSPITGYRRIPLSTCQGGTEYDVAAETFPCPGHGQEYAKKHGISGVGLFFAIVIPIAAAAGIGYWVWANWDNKFGRIRLGSDNGPLATSTGYDAFDRDAPWIKYPVMALSGVVAVLAAVPMVVGSLWGLVSTRLGRSRGAYARPYTSRDSFARGRGGYAAVDDDEGSLLGEGSEDEV